MNPAAGAPLDHPVIVIKGYTSPVLPDSISINGVSQPGVNYFASVDAAGQRLFITVNQSVSAALSLHVAAPTSTPTPTPVPPPVSAPTVSVSVKGSPTASEDGMKGKFVVSRAGADLSGGLTVLFKLKGSAQDGVDYQEVSGSVTIPAGSADAKVKIKPIDNQASDGTRTVTLKLLASPTGAYIVASGSAKKATLSILDND